MIFVLNCTFIKSIKLGDTLIHVVNRISLDHVLILISEGIMFLDSFTKRKAVQVKTSWRKNMLCTVSLLHLFIEFIPTAGSLSCCYGEACLSQTWAHSWWESEGANLFTPYFRMWLLVVSYLCPRSITICITNQLNFNASIKVVHGWCKLPYNFFFSF